MEDPGVKLLEPAELLVDGQADLVPSFPRRLQELRATGRGQGDGLDIGQQDAEAEGDPELEEIAPDDALHEHDRDEDGHDGQGRGQGGKGDLFRSFESRRHEGLAALAMAKDVFHDHDGVVDDDADGQGQSQQGERVEGEAEEVDDGHRAEEGHGDGQDDVERAREGSEEEPADEGREHDREQELELDLLDRLADELRTVVGDADGHVARAGSSCRWSSVSRTFWATATALAPRCFLMPMPWAGPPSTRAMRRTSSKPSSTMATSLI